MNICLYSPYIPKHRGGGEMYLLQVASVLQDKHKVYLAISEDWFTNKKGELTAAGLTDLSDEGIIKHYQSFFDLPLDKISIIRTPIGTNAKPWKKWSWTKQWDVMYYLTDGSIFPSFARKNILHIQVPLKISKKSLWEQIKLGTWQVKNTNSHFTKEIVSNEWPVHIDHVHSPFVELPESTEKAGDLPHKKSKTIVHIGRFFKQLHSKRQDKIIDTFKKMVDQYPEKMSGWKLHLIGGVEDKEYTESLYEQAKDAPIFFHHNLSRDQVINYLTNARIYWHATGYGVDQYVHPEKVEHFGISTIEAMAAGCVPIVINAGGQPEALGKSLQSCLWNTQKQWIENTVHVIENPELEKSLQKKAINQSTAYSKKQFTALLELMIHSQ